MLSTIRQRLVLLVLLVALPLVAATSFVIQHFAQTHQEAQRRAIVASTHALAAAVDAEINKHLAVAHALATSRSLRIGDLAAFYEQALDAMTFLPDSWLLVVDPEGNQLINTSRPYGELLPPIGNRVAQQRAMQNGQAQVSDIFQGQIVKRPLASVHVPVMREGRAAYDVIITLDPKSFLRILQDQRLPEGWIAAVIDRKGNFVARSLDHETRVGTPASEGWRAAAAKHDQGRIENVSVEGAPLFAAFTNSPLSGWSVSIGATQQAIHAPFYRSVWLMAMSAIGLIGISIALAWWAARWTARPLRALERAARSLPSEEPAKLDRTGLYEVDEALAAFEASSRALIEREVARQQTESQFRTLADSIPQLAWMTDGNGGIIWFNKRFYDFTGTTFEDMQGWGWRQVHHPDHVDAVVAGIMKSFETGEPWEDTFPLRRADGEYRWFLSRALPIRDVEGNIVRWFGTNTDVSEQKRTEERQRLLVNELNHRVKNTLAVIQSIAAVTARSAPSAAAFSKSFIARIVGIARTHDLLTASHWEGASLCDVIANELDPYQSEGAPRVSLRGEPVWLKPKIAVALGMVMHELATNAAKYGALSTQDGRIDVTWSVHDGSGGRLLRLEWSESGGPEVAAPMQPGFGSRLVTQSIERDLQGRIEIDYRRQGLRSVIELPLGADLRPAQAA